MVYVSCAPAVGRVDSYTTPLAAETNGNPLDVPLASALPLLCPSLDVDGSAFSSPLTTEYTRLCDPGDEDGFESSACFAESVEEPPSTADDCVPTVDAVIAFDERAGPGGAADEAAEEEGGVRVFGWTVNSRRVGPLSDDRSTVSHAPGSTAEAALSNEAVA